ncbi:MAG TPA: hypothetical protein VFR47_12945 [Anaerolineales bacterium]|nr:hypothetical protein [Anaerolineales bacterium]
MQSEPDVLIIGAPTTSSADATMEIYISDTKVNNTPYVIPPGRQQSPKFEGTFAGPVRGAAPTDRASLPASGRSMAAVSRRRWACPTIN